ncbi:MAG: MBOAT family protein, partial [Lachnospiraceae bacterium]|nr:MBOAT family protein [Lachnospiraceae bacterium]
TGAVLLLGSVLYSVQLYADFLACVTIAQGVASAFGIRLMDNFHHPYFASTVQDFWRRWHMSLSFWLRDYVYIPLGGNRKGKIRKHLNLIITFLVSGFWHGGLALNYLFWGLLHAFYQLIGSFTIGIRNRIWNAVNLNPKSFPVRLLRAMATSFLVMIAWIFFRADSLFVGLDMTCRMFRDLKWTELKDLIPTVLKMGAFMDPKEWYVLIVSIGILLIISLLQSKYVIKDLVSRLYLPARWLIYVSAILIVVIFGSYGHGFNAADFIYGGF